VVDFPEPFGPEESGHDPRLNGEAEPVHRALLPIVLGQIARLDHGSNVVALRESQVRMSR
jgi:hypothetical protein